MYKRGEREEKKWRIMCCTWTCTYVVSQCRLLSLSLSSLDLLELAWAGETLISLETLQTFQLLVDLVHLANCIGVFLLLLLVFIIVSPLCLDKCRRFNAIRVKCVWSLPQSQPERERARIQKNINLFISHVKIFWSIISLCCSVFFASLWRDEIFTFCVCCIYLLRPALCALEEQQSRKIYYTEREKKTKRTENRTKEQLIGRNCCRIFIDLSDLEIDYSTGNQATPKVMHMSHSTSLRFRRPFSQGFWLSCTSSARLKAHRSAALTRNFHLLSLDSLSLWHNTQQLCVLSSCL